MDRGGAGMSAAEMEYRTDLRLEELPFTYGGKTYLLRCNMNVLADVQEAFGGDFNLALTGSTFRAVLEFLAAMLNDYADEQRWPERYTARVLGRDLRPDEIPMGKIMGLVTRALTPPETAADAKPEPEPDEAGN